MKVTVLSTSLSTEKEAIENMGADSVMVSSNTEHMKAAVGTLDGFIDTVSAVHAIHLLLFLLKTYVMMTLIGAPEKPLQLPAYSLIFDFDGTMTYGGYSNMIVDNEHFVIQFLKNLPLEKGAPLLCAVKSAKAFGMKVTVISTCTSLSKKEAIENLGADSVMVSSNPEHMKAAIGTLDGIIDTVSAVHAIHLLLFLLKTHGKMILIGSPEKPQQLVAYSLIFGRKTLAGSCFDGIKDTQEIIDFAADHNIPADIELIRIDYVNEAMDRLAKADVQYRFVMDIGITLNAT